MPSPALTFEFAEIKAKFRCVCLKIRMCQFYDSTQTFFYLINITIFRTDFRIITKNMPQKCGCFELDIMEPFNFLFFLQNSHHLTKISHSPERNPLNLSIFLANESQRIGPNNPISLHSTC